MREILILIGKGFLIGLAKIIPGLSGSLLAVSLGVYELGIEAICNFFHNPIKYLPFLGIAGSGVLLGIMVGSRTIFYFLSYYYLPTMLLFMGLIVGTLPRMIKQKFTFSKTNFMIVLIIIILFLFLNQGIEGKQFIYQNNLSTNLYLILLGFIDASTMIIPGVSGTAIFLLLGVYPFILNMFARLPFFFSYLPFYFFISGLIIGIFLVSKLMNYLFSKKEDTAYAGVIGFALASFIVLIMNLFDNSYSISNWCFSLILFFFGIFICLKFD